MGAGDVAGLVSEPWLAQEAAETHDKMMPAHATTRTEANLEVSFVGTQYHALLCCETNEKTFGHRRLKLGLEIKKEPGNRM